MRSLSHLHWDIGRIIVSRQQDKGWGKLIVECLGTDLRREFPGTTSFSARNIWYMRKFYLLYQGNPKLQPLVAEIAWTHKSHRGTQFRIWATERLREYIIKGFALDDDRLKRAGKGTYFEELLARIRDIRSSEKVFWRKVLDIYATSIDYDHNTETSKLFFATVQNKMHWAAHGHTAAEILYWRADATRENMGLTNWTGDAPSKSEAIIAKNYLTSEELDMLNRIVMAYLEFAEIQALGRRPMYMRDWAAKLDEFFKGQRA